jgi:transposase-like protein
MVFCPTCFSNLVKKYGLDRKGYQRYMCTSCGKQFTSKTDTYFSKMRYPRVIVTFGLTLHFRHNYTFREVAEYLKECGIEISHVAIHGWAKKFLPFIATYRFKPYTNIWHINESEAIINGERKRLYIVFDSNGNILSIRLSNRKSAKQAELAIKNAINLTGLKPKTIMGAEVEKLVARAI